jgi:hypothetical protein
MGILNYISATSVENENNQQETRFIGKHLDISLMSGSTIVEAWILGKPLLEGERKKIRRKCIKKMLEPVSISLGSKTRLNNVMELEERLIVGHFPRKKMSCECLKD